MREIKIQSDELVESLFVSSENANVCLLDSCGVSYLDSHILIAGINPVKILEISNETAENTLNVLEREITQEKYFGIFTISYDFGLKIQNIEARKKTFTNFGEPDVFLALFDCVIVHDYRTRKTFLCGNEAKFSEIESELFRNRKFRVFSNYGKSKIASNFSRDAYLKIIETVKELIRSGDTYQTNLTQRIEARLAENLTPQRIFHRLRKNHPAPFSAFIKRKNDYVVSISPERFFKVENRKISTSPIKGTRPRGKTRNEDLRFRDELLNSSKDRAENIMIVDLLRNDLGRVCKFGSVKTEKMCDLETHPTFFHLVSTVSGELLEKVSFADIIRAVFPCGSITGAPKISTMRIIEELETANRGLSMGTIGYFSPISKFNDQNLNSLIPNDFDLSVAIRTLVIKNREAVFNVGGGIVIDSDAEKEYEETLVKAKAILSAINGEF